MPLWRITPAAEPDDPRWMTGPIFEEVIVRAPLASAARVAAAEMEARLFPYDDIRNHAHLEASAFPSAFFDEKLYHVEAALGHAEPGGPEGEAEVLSARMREG